MPADANPPSIAARGARKDEVIQVRASAETKAMLNRAASLRGQKLSQFVLESARREAEGAILDQRVFFLAPEAYDSFVRLLEAPSAPNAALVELMRRQAPWET